MTTQEVIAAMNHFGKIQEQLFNGEIHEPRLIDKSPEALSFRAAERAFLKAQAILDTWKKIEQLEDGAAIFQADDGQMVRYTVQRLFGEHAACVSIERLALVEVEPVSTPDTLDTLGTLVAAAIAAYPGEEARILRGAEIVRKGGVRLVEGECPKVGQTYHLYSIVDGRCPCPDSAQGNAPEGRCKHVHALTLYVQLQREAMKNPQYLMSAEVQKRFWSHVDKCNHNALCTQCCWNWNGSNAKGYGSFHLKKSGVRVTWRANRVSWIYAHGEIPEGLWVLHTCDNPACVNPSHLWLGTPDDNQKDSMQKGRRPMGDNHGLRLHPESLRYGEDNPAAKLTAIDVQMIRIRHQEGWTQEKIATHFKTSRQNVGHIIHGDSWKHLPSTTSLPAGPAFRVKYFWASVGHTNGQAKICEDGQCWFRAGWAGEWVPCSWEDIGFGGSIDAEQVA